MWCLMGGFKGSFEVMVATDHGSQLSSQLKLSKANLPVEKRSMRALNSQSASFSSSIERPIRAEPHRMNMHAA